MGNGTDEAGLDEATDEDATAAQKGDREAGERLAKRFRPYAIRVATRCGVAHLDDAAAEGMLALVEAIRKYDPAKDKPFRVFAKSQIRWGVVRVLYSEREEADACTSLDAGDEPLLDTIAIDCDSPETEAARAEVWARVESLPEQLRSVLLGWFAGSTQNDIAQSMGVTQGRVAQITREALGRLRAA
jgi:RNA polymerase sigma factor (sigma-70 family)